MKVAIVGAGWAGLAAASECLERGLSVTVFDAAHHPGGRARAVQDPALGELDNGQHLLIGAYRQTLRIMRRDVGASVIDNHLQRLPLWLRSADRSFEIRQTAANNTPTAQAWMLLRAQGLSLTDKWQVARFLRRLSQRQQDWLPSHGALTVAQWLALEHQGDRSCRWLWYPLCIATMNTAPDQACARLFARVIRDSLLNPEPGATDLLIPSVPLGQLWPETIAKRVTARWGHVVKKITPVDQGMQIDGEAFDACVLATPPANTCHLLAPETQFAELCRALEAFDYRSIATCYVEVSEHFPLPAPLLMFDHGRFNSNLAPSPPSSSLNARAHWVFDRPAILNEPPKAQLAFVISDANNLNEPSDLALAKSLVEQLEHALERRERAQVVNARCFVEKRATFAAVPELIRPAVKTGHERLVLAGDWTDTGYPAVLEGAVRSGIAAVNALMGHA
jgi:squalene-associated FAD-dependent desaturase